MNLDSSYFRAIQGSVNCNNKKEVKISDAKKRFDRNFDDSVGVVYDAKRNNIPQDFIITKSNKDIVAFPRSNEEINIGDIIFWNNFHWLVTDNPFYNEIYKSGIIIRCNREIKWQNPITKEIISRWCFAERPYATGVDEGNLVSMPNRDFRVKIPYDNETIQVDIGKRFVLETINGIQKTYKLEMADLNTNKFQDSDGGFIVWNLKFDTNINSDTDNIELGICDYITPDTPVPPQPDPQKMTCSISGNSEIKCGYSRTYTPTFYDTNGNIIVDIVPLWTLIPPENHSNYFSTQLIENKIKVICSDNENLIGDILTLKLINSDKTAIENEFKIEVVSAFG